MVQTAEIFRRELVAYGCVLSNTAEHVRADKTMKRTAIEWEKRWIETLVENFSHDTTIIVLVSAQLRKFLDQCHLGW